MGCELETEDSGGWCGGKGYHNEDAEVRGQEGEGQFLKGLEAAAQWSGCISGVLALRKVRRAWRTGSK